ncbi:hypothetical protein O181_015452 [Austropuccinia psidii MF-1]|uniref:Uncharacterized protein n=1 Tax=Austropuccinia psidii MF-1 TaxID=1389203 RepID=A0A9Q3GQS8_9BASI|nr:hypothetical protein [Austropuccinia psidii MF-1]
MPTPMLELSSASPLNPLQHLECLGTHTPNSSSPQLTILMLLRGPQVMPLTPPSPPLMPPCTCLILSATYHPNACGVPSQRCLPSLRSWSGFLTCLQCRLPCLCLHSTHPPCFGHCLPSLCLQCPPDMTPTLLTILTLVQCPPNMPLTPPSH